LEKKFSYTGIHHLRVLISQLSGIAGILIFTFIAGFLLFGYTKIHVPSNVTVINDPRTTLICLVSWILIISWVISLSFINFYPTVWLNDDGLKISAFLFFQVYIPWQDIIDMRQVNSWGLALVRAKRITLFHRFYSWSYSLTLSPGFLIGKNIDNRDILIEEIREKLNRMS
jgi:hypothetical protein